MATEEITTERDMVHQQEMRERDSAANLLRTMKQIARMGCTCSTFGAVNWTCPVCKAKAAVAEAERGGA